MVLTPGTRLGAYEIQAAIGAGGMGEVYRALDTNLKRQVALKVLPTSVAGDADRLARFQREAEILAALNHPNIAAIHGVERSTHTTALVMELVEGEDLSARIKRGAIPLDEALPIAGQIAEALEAAHDAGIIHRDLKPANIKVRPDARVKVLDFGLAKAAAPIWRGQDQPESPTMAATAMSEAGLILGTVAYMSPEQARGKPTDTGTDIWAFGCVLYEMVTGEKAFEGESVSDTLVRVIEREPQWARLPATLSPDVRTYLTRCLQKDRRQRVQSIGDVRLALEGAFATPAVQTVPAQRRHAASVALGAVIASAATVGTLVWLAMRGAEPVPPRVARLDVAAFGTAALTVNGNDRDLDIASDGSRIVYVGNNGTQLFVRALESLEPVAVFSGMPRGPFIAPDGQWIGFWEDTTLLKVKMTGGPAVSLTRLEGEGPRGATWGPDDTIIAATYGSAAGLRRVAATGESTTVLTRPDHAQGEVDHLWPEMLPGGRAVLFTITAATGGLEAAEIAVLDLQTGTQRILIRGGSHAHYVASRRPAKAGSGHLVFAAAGTLRAVPFDLDRLETRGTPVAVVNDVVTTPNGGVDSVIARDGTLAYVSGGSGTAAAERTLVWVNRQGQETPIPAPARAYAFPRLSPDGRRVVAYVQDQDLDLWAFDFGRATLTRTTFDRRIDGFPVWTPDGRRVIFNSARVGTRNLFWQAADGTGIERLAESPNQQDPSAVTADGRGLIFTEVHPKTGSDVMLMMLDEKRRVTPLVNSTFNEKNGVVSPDGRWLAYEANDSGQYEIWVRPFPSANSEKWQVTTTGGTRPLWSPNGQELFYVSPTGAVMRVGVERGPSWAVTTSTVAVKQGYFTTQGGFPARSYDITRDGQKFLMIKTTGISDRSTTPARLVVVQNWVQELERLVPN